MKRILALILALVMTMALVACGGDKTTTSTPSTTTPSTSTPSTTEPSKPAETPTTPTEPAKPAEPKILHLTSKTAAASGLSLDMAFLCYEEDGSAYVWAEKRGRLEKRPVTLGSINDMQGTVEILSGLTEEDYIAFPYGKNIRDGAKAVPCEDLSQLYG